MSRPTEIVIEIMHPAKADRTVRIVAEPDPDQDVVNYIEGELYLRLYLGDARDLVEAMLAAIKHLVKEQ